MAKQNSQIQKSISTPKAGMNRDKAAFDLENSEYSFALNSNFNDEHGSGDVNLQNEPSNIYCSGFKTGYKVIGHKYDINADKTYFFLVNPTTGCSEIGYISSFHNIDSLEQVESSCNCNITVILESPLEQQTKVETCEYTTLLSDCDCEQSNKCLNFSINHPIHEPNIHLKDEFSGRVLYFTDGYNPPRYIQLDRLDIYTTDVDDCTGEVTPTCLDCEEMRIFKLYDKPCLKVDTLQNGGNLRAGTYEMAIAYSTQEGFEITPYFALTIPTPIFDSNNTVLDQTDLNYQTNFSIRLSLFDLDKNYEYVKVAVIYRSGLDASITVVENGVYPIGTDSVAISTLVDKKALVLQDLFLGKTFYETARGMASGNGYLFQYGMKAHREINLQPIANLLGSFVKWSTVMAEEDIYENGALVSNFKGYMRDEVYPLGIKFFLDGGYETPVFHFVPRPPTDFEIEELGIDYDEDDNNQSILEYNPDCTGNDRKFRWQYENTASILGDCLVPANPAYGTQTYTETIQSVCYADLSTNPNSIVPVGSVVIPRGDTLVNYINNNVSTILGFSDPSWLDIQTALTTVYTETCEPYFGSNCGTPTVIDTEIVAYVTDSEAYETVGDTTYTNYVRVKAPGTAAPFDIIDIPPVLDTTFINSYLRPWEKAYKRAAISNTNCLASAFVAEYIDTTPSPSPTWLNYAGVTSLTNDYSALQTTIDVSAISVIDGYTNKLHTNARWYKVSFNGIGNAIVELSTNTVLVPDDVCQDSYRINVFDSCSSTSDLAAYSRIITDASLLNDTNKFLVLDASDFPSGEAFIAIDSPIKTDVEWTLTLSGTSGSIDLDIDGNTYSIPFATDIATTIANFITTHTTPTTIDSVVYDILDGTTSLIQVDSTTTQLIFRTTEAEYVSATVTSITPDLLGVISPTTYFHVIKPFCGSANIYTRQLLLQNVVDFTDLVFVKKVIAEADCEFSKPILNGCDPIPKEYGLFSYWESTEKYPCNDDLYDSSKLCVRQDVISGYLTVDELNEFESYYTNGIDTDGCYIWKLDINGKPLIDFRDRAIRHYKFPCSTLVPFMSSYTENPGDYQSSVIYPIGFSITNESINAFLDTAVSNGLLTLEERLRIKKYEIFRGDRSVDRSVIAKGLLFDMYNYKDGYLKDNYQPEQNNDTIFYSNYPFNTLGPDNLNGFTNTNTPLSSYTKNYLYTFHSPDIHYYKPFLPREMKIEGYQFGKSRNYFDVVEDHPTYVILGKKAYTLASTLAWAEVLFDTSLSVLDLTVNASTGTIGLGVGVVAVAAAVALVIFVPFKVSDAQYKWISTFYNLGHLNQFAYYSAGIGHYNYFLPNNLSNDRLRGIATIKYLKDGRYNIPTEVSTLNLKVNNFNREDSVFINLTNNYPINYPSDYYNYDNVLTSSTPSRIKYLGKGKSESIKGDVASPYASLKLYLPSQYGSIQSVDWVHTNFCGILNESIGCNPIFGGDIFISRFAVKRKFSFFKSNSFGLAPRTPFRYSDYFNVNPAIASNRYYVDYLLNNDADFTSFFGFSFPSNRTNYNLYDGGSDINSFYVKPPNKFFLFSYGFPYFLSESVINSNFRYAKREKFQNFYPNINDVIEFTQEKNVTIREPNYYYYNFVYSSIHSSYRKRTLPDNYDPILYAGTENLDNTTIYSRQDNSETSLTDPWLIYRALDTYTFPKTFGKLINMDSIESEAIMARFENGITMFGAIDQLRDRLTQETGNIGQGGIFAGRSINFNKTDLGYAGTQHVAKVSCEFGHFYTDAKRGQVFQIEANASGISEITNGLEKWFKENLPFKITQYIPNITQEALDNPFKGLGITMGWDSRSKRIFLTKLDYIPKVSNIKFIAGEFYLEDGDDLVLISLKDTNYFKECSFTVAYSPLTKTWISYYSFKPNYYIAYNNYFQTGVNYSVDTSEEGLWSHLPFLSSYQVFYGKRYAFTIEYPTVTKAYNSVLNSIEYWLDVRKYYNKHDFSDVFGFGFNKAYIYNNYQNSGQLNLVHQKNNDLSQSLMYPRHNVDSIDILQSEMNGRWTFNYLYNLIRSEKSGLPIWKYDCGQVEKTLDNRLLDYRSTYKDRLRGDYFLIRLQQDAESRYKMIFRFHVDERNYYEQ